MTGNLLDLTQEISKILKNSFTVSYLEINDQSLRHQNHAEAQKSGGGHFELILVSKDFISQPLIERHRMIYHSLENFASHIHALRIKALTPAEWENMRKE